MVADSKSNKYDTVIKKSKQMAVTFHQKEANDQILRNNLHMMGNIKKIQTGVLRSSIPKRTYSLKAHEFKSLNFEAMVRNQERIDAENRKMNERVQFSCSTLKKDTLLKSSKDNLRHINHLSKYFVSKRQFDKLPKILDTRGVESSPKVEGHHLREVSSKNRLFLSNELYGDK